MRQEQTLTALQKLGDQAARAGDYTQAINLFEKAVAIDSLRDEPLRALMLALSAKGDVNGSLRAYREFAHRLNQSMGGVPDEQTAELYVRLRRQSLQRARTPKFEQQPREVPKVGRLPHFLNSLIGREDERADVVSQLRLRRLVSLTGVGGIGKIRLAIEVASEIQNSFPDGVWFVSLEALSEGTQVAQAIASALDFRVEAGSSPLDALAKGLRSKQILLVLDNCEHLLSPCIEVCEILLRICGELRLLVTSRESLRMAGESVYVVPGLSVPIPEHLPSQGATRVRVALSYESVALFVERAQSVAPHFVLDANNAVAVANICARLEGIPLAIELASVQASSMSVSSIASHLENLLGPSATGVRVLPPRQQTVHSTLDWSYQLLRLDERRLLARLSVFVGGWTLDAAESVAKDGAHAEQPIGQERVASVLRSLVDKSLVVFEQRRDRYRLLEPVRQYAAERLLASGEKSVVQATHQWWFLQFAEQAEIGLEGGEQSLWTAKVAVEEENLLAAMDDTETSLLLASAVFRFWYIRGEFEKGLRRLDQALSMCPDPTVARRKALYAAGILLYCQKRYDKAQLLCHEALAIAERVEERIGAALALNLLAMIAHQNGEHDQERVYREQGLHIFREVGYQRGIVGAISNDAYCSLCRGEYQRARPILQEALQITSDLGDLTNICVVHLQLGAIECHVGNYEASLKHYETCHELQEVLSSKRGIAMAKHGMGKVRNILGHTEVARAFYYQSLDLFREIGDKPGEAAMLCALAEIEGQELRLVSAKEFIGASLTLMRKLDNKVSLAEALRVTATLARLSNELGLAEAAMCECLQLVHQSESPQLAVEAFEELGVIYLKRAKLNQAAKIWGVAGALRQLIGSPIPPDCEDNLQRWRSEVMVLLGKDQFLHTTAEGAALNWREVAREFEAVDVS